MSYPADSSIKSEMQINGVWTDISTYVRAASGVTISRGRADEQSRISAQSARFTLNQRDGRFSNRNPLSPYFGLLPLNTPVRFSAGTGDNFLRFPYNSRYLVAQQDMAYTTDKAALDIVGDLEVRVDVDPHTWRPAQVAILASKYVIAGAQRSWAFYLSNLGTLNFTWSTDGTTTGRRTAISTASVPTNAGRLSLKATIDVDNGAGGTTVAFYTATSINGTYTQLGTSVVSAGTTSIFGGTAPVAVGAGYDQPGIFTDGMPFGGKIYSMRLLSGIAGSAVAAPDFSTMAIDATSLTDGANTWLLVGRARVSSNRIRFVGEASSLPQRWDLTGTDVYVPAVASGMIRRLTQGASPLRSPIYRNLSQYNLNGYWPGEDGFTATSLASGLSNGKPATFRTGDIAFGVRNDLPGASQGWSFDNVSGKVSGFTARTTATGTASLVFYLNLTALPASIKTLAVFTSTGTAARIEFGMGSASYEFALYNAAGTSLGTSSTSISGINPVNNWIGVNLLLTTSGANVNWAVRWLPLAGTVGGIGPFSYAGSVGYFNGFNVDVSSDAAYAGASLMHIALALEDLDFTKASFKDSSNAYFGELAGTRMERLTLEEAVSFELTGFVSDTEAMGYQTTDTLLNLLYACADVDMGLLAEARDFLQLTYVTRLELYNRADLTLSMTASHLSEVPEPTPDDQGVVNDVEVTRTGGSSARYAVTTGPMSVQAPPNGVGRYDTAVTLNAASDDRLLYLASWKANLGSVNEARYPSVAVGMHRSEVTAAVFSAVANADLGSSAALTGMPTWLPPEDAVLLIQGYTETLKKFLWDINFNCAPGSPYRPGLWNDGTVRYDSASTTNKAAVTSSGTAITFRTTNVLETWSTTSTPYEVFVSGERVRVTSMGAPALVSGAYDQAATVVRSINGIEKALPAGSSIRIATPGSWAL